MERVLKSRGKPFFPTPSAVGKYGAGFAKGRSWVTPRLRCKQSAVCSIVVHPVAFRELNDGSTTQLG